MSEQQLYIAVGLPTIVALIGILVNIGYFVAINGRIGSLETRLDNRMTSLEAKFDILVGKVIELGNRLVRLEERLKH
jgi:hypothetical protein